MVNNCSKDGTEVTVSIIMGIYNMTDEKILRLAIESVINQTFNDWEFIIWDDGSTDNTIEIVKKIIKIDNRIRLLHDDVNKGLASALNSSIKEVRGKYIARMDSDDICHPDRLREELLFLETHSEYGFVGTNVQLIDDEGVWGKRVMPEKPNKDSMLFRSPFVHPTIMIRTEILKGVKGYRVVKETRRAEDYDLFMRLYAQGYKGYNIQKELFQYREDRASLRKRKYRYRVDEAKVRMYGFKRLGLFPKAVPYVIKPLIVGLLPYKLLIWMRGDRK